MIVKDYLEIVNLCQDIKRSFDHTDSIVFTNGCFDLFHYGHLHLLEQARRYGNLIVGLNSDASIKKFKDPSRPIINERQRAEILQAIHVVKHVIIFDEKVPRNLIAQIEPDFIVKGVEYTPDELEYMTGLALRKPEIITIDKIPEISTSTIIKVIKECT
jgi:D-beta-D-heptose 7-phosphate kinase/D-beta-D-heptose 1-phosphate adenosyltransferase